MRAKLVAVLQAPWFVAVVALLLRLGWLLHKVHTIPAAVLATAPFENEVGNVAAALASGKGFCCLFRQPTGPTAWLSPVYPLLLAGIFKIFGAVTFRSFCASVFLNSAFSALASFPIFYAGERIAGKFAATLATWFWAASPLGIILTYAWIWDSSLSAFLAASLLWATLRIADRPSLLAFACYGLLWGVSLLSNPALGAVLPFLLVWILVRLCVGNAQRVHFLLVSTAVILIACLPWTLRNYLQFHRFIPLRSNFAYEFWSGNNEIFDPNSQAVNRITRYEQTHLYARLGESQFLDQKWHAATFFVRTHPALYAQLCARRMIATWFGTDSPWQDFSHADSSLARFLLFWNAPCFVAILVGLIRLYFGRRCFFVPLAVFPLIFPITFYLAHTSLRHRHPSDPVFALLIAIAFLGCVQTKAPRIG